MSRRQDTTVSQSALAHRLPGLVSIATGLVALAALSACGGSEGGNSGRNFGQGSASGTGAANGAGGGFIGNTGGVGGGLVDPGNGGGQAPAGCGGDVYQAESRGLDMYIMVDRSGSMFIPVVLDLWTPVGTALGTFVTDPATTGISAGINFFPPKNANECDVGFYGQPIVPIAPLPQNGPAIQQAIVDHIPTFGETPTLPAMQGAVQQARAHAMQNPDKAVIVVLATDGAPNQCNSDVAGVAQAAADGLNGSPSVRTFVIGLGNVNGLNQIAQAGGGTAILVDPNPAVTSQQFLAAMDQIRGLALPCDYGLPDGTTDPAKVNLSFTPAGGAAEFVPNVGDANGCAGGPGWYYDNPAAPTRLITCDATCGQFRQLTDGQVNVVLGCDTVVR